MSRNAQKPEPQPWEGHVCDECKHGTWNDAYWNRDLHGKPITLRCSHYKDGKLGIIRSTKACEKFQNR